MSVFPAATAYSTLPREQTAKVPRAFVKLDRGRQLNTAALKLPQNGHIIRIHTRGEAVGGCESGEIRMRFVFVAVAVTTIGSCAFADDGGNSKLQGDILRKAVSGKTVHLATPLGTLPIRFRMNGTMSGTAGELAAYTGSAADSGRWWVSSEKLCQRWQTWLDGKTYCFTLRQEGGTVHWVRNDGLSGKATIVR